MTRDDLTMGGRNLRRRPGFALTAILLLTLGAGANAAVLSVVRGVLLRPLPYPQPDRLVALWPGEFVSNEELDYWRHHTRSFDSIAAQAAGWLMALTDSAGEPLKVTGAKTSDNLFKTLGAHPVLGRVIEPGDSDAGRPRVALLSDGLWRRRFASSPDVVGTTIHLDQEPHVVIGVMPPGFEIFEPGTEVWVALPWEPGTSSFRTTFSQGVARLATAAPIDAATRELQSLAPAMRRDLKRGDAWGRTLRVASLQDAITGDVRPTLLILLGAVGLMLLLAAVNVGTLMLGRSVERVREMAVRTALGASRRRLIRQLVVEQSLLAIA
ncbi:MAG: ABC transporter permease [Acidobacteria bacterium]|nr:ABC transporter permease [Acidobacteriota bacterium]